MKILELRNLKKRFGDRVIFEGANVSFPKNGCFFIIGDSGSGKSTLLNILSGCDINYTGDVLFDGISLSEKSDDERAEYRLHNYGFIRQSYDLLELEDVYHNVSFPLNGLGCKKRDIKKKVYEVLSYLGIKDKAKQKTNTLSGGEKQRVAIARALVTDPKIILADEPTGALDSVNSKDVYAILKEVSKKRLVIIVSHDVEAANTYGDKIISLRDKKLIVDENEPSNETKEEYVSFKPEKEKESKWSIFLWLKHASNLMKAKRFRSMLMIGIITFSLLSLGLSVYVKKDLGNQMNSMFASLSGVNGIVMESNSKNENTFGKIISASEESILKLEKEYPEEIDGHGINYLCQYENYFKDENEMYFDSFGKKTIIPSLSVRNINEYQWLENLSEENEIYPERPNVMENEQIVLGLPYASMAKICLSLHIERTYYSLGNYLRRKPLEIYLETANSSWGYADSQLFSLVGVFEESVTTIYHMRRDWNEYVLEECMGFPTSDESKGELPWILQKIYYINPKKDKETFFAFARKEKLLDQYVFERDSYDYDETHNSKNEISSSKRLYVYRADKTSLKYASILGIVDKYNFENYSVLGESSYISYPSAMISGFAFPFLLSSSKDNVVSFADSVSRMPKDESFINVEIPQGIVSGYYLKSKGNSLTISSDFSSKIDGQKPESMNEICVSSALWEKLDKKKELFCEGVVGQEESEAFTNYDFRLGELKVTGVIESDDLTIFTLPTWSIDYFRDYLGMSSFSLEPKKVIFYCDSSESESIISSLSNEYPSLYFSSPSLLAEDSISNVIEYASIALNFASIITISTSFLLFACSALLLTLENKKEGKLFHELGVKREAVFDSFSANLLLVTIICSFLSSISLFFAEFILKQTLGASLQTKIKMFSFDLEPHLMMFLFSLIGLVISVLFLRLYLRKKMDTNGNL